jgi:hypothetical protein
MTETTDWNSKTIAEFRANKGRVSGPFEGAPMVLVHHRGRKSGREYVNPMMYLPHDADDNIIYVFATKAGAPPTPTRTTTSPPPARAVSNAEPSPTRSPSAS